MPRPDAAPGAVVEEIYVQPGESYLVSGPAVLRTVLGSCVGATFLVPRMGLAGICHPMLPACPPAHRARISARSGLHYVDFAIRNMARQLEVQGAARGEMVVKLFGGNDVLTMAEGSSRPTIGKLNAEVALRILEEEGLTVAASCLGGKRGVHITFDTVTGEVLLRRLNSNLQHRGRSAGRTAHRSGSGK